MRQRLHHHLRLLPLPVLHEPQRRLLDDELDLLHGRLIHVLRAVHQRAQLHHPSPDHVEKRHRQSRLAFLHGQFEVWKHVEHGAGGLFDGPQHLGGFHQLLYVQGGWREGRGTVGETW